MAITIRNLDAALGAEVGGIPSRGRCLRAKSSESKMSGASGWSLCSTAKASRTRNSLPSAGSLASSIRPGPIPMASRSNKEHPEINVISNVVENGKPIGNLGDGEAVWHADMTYVDVPPKAAMLHSLEVPPTAAATPTSPTCSRPTRRCRRS